MSLPLGWDNPTGTAMPGAAHNVSVTVGGSTVTFNFHVFKQMSSSRELITLTLEHESYGLSFLIRDITSYSGNSNPRDTLGDNYTTGLIMALRQLVMGGAAGIPKPGDQITYGSGRSSIVDSVTIGQLSEKTVDAFEVRCSFKKPDSVTLSGNNDNRPKTARTDEVPPWQEPATIRFEAHIREGHTFGYAYKTEDIEERPFSDMVSLRKKGISTGDKLQLVANTAGDPFRSPPLFPKTSGVLHIEAAFLKDEGDINITTGVVNRTEIEVKMKGARLSFPAGTLALSSFGVTPQLYKMPIPWYTKTKHPLNKTYGELFYGYSGQVSNKVALNGMGSTIIVHKPMYYLRMTAALEYRPEGFGVWIANRGYEEKKDGKLKAIIDPATQSHKESWLDKDGAKTTDKKIWRGYTMHKSTDDIQRMLNKFFTTSDVVNISWATTKDNYGKKVD